MTDGLLDGGLAELSNGERTRCGYSGFLARKNSRTA